jgi:hypothetical protein
MSSSTTFHSNVTFDEATVPVAPAVPAQRKLWPSLMVVTVNSTYVLKYLPARSSDGNPAVSCLSGTYGGVINGEVAAMLRWSDLTGRFGSELTAILQSLAYCAELDSLDKASEETTVFLKGYVLEARNASGRLIVSTTPVQSAWWVLA